MKHPNSPKNRVMDYQFISKKLKRMNPDIRRLLPTVQHEKIVKNNVTISFQGKNQSYTSLAIAPLDTHFLLVPYTKQNPSAVYVHLCDRHTNRQKLRLNALQIPPAIFSVYSSYLTTGVNTYTNYNRNAPWNALGFDRAFVLVQQTALLHWYDQTSCYCMGVNWGRSPSVIPVQSAAPQWSLIRTVWRTSRTAI